jgi:hypothetical protein
MASGKLGRDNIRRALKGFADLLAFDSDGMSEIARDGIENGRIQKFEYCAGASAKRLRSGSTSASSPIWPRIQPVSMLPAGSLPGAPPAESPDTSRGWRPRQGPQAGRSHSRRSPRRVFRAPRERREAVGLTEPGPIREILTHLGGPLEPPPIAADRGPPTDWGELLQAHDDRDVFQASPDELPVIDIHSL